MPLLEAFPRDLSSSSGSSGVWEHERRSGKDQKDIRVPWRNVCMAEWSGHFPEGPSDSKGGCPAPHSAPGWILPCCYGYQTQAIVRSVLDMLVCQKSLKTTSCHPCDYPGSFHYLKAISVCPNYVASCILQYRHTLNILYPLQDIRASSASLLPMYIHSIILAGKPHYSRHK